jgi:cyclopropane fatty-acyl-phospholipid synthase-like methyltransferase
VITNDHSEDIRYLLYGHLASRALSAVAALGIPDLLASGPREISDICDKTGARPSETLRLMRALTFFDVFAVESGEKFSLTSLGRMLTTDAFASALPTALLVNGAVGRAWDHIQHTLATGEPAFESLYGQDFFSYLEENSGMREIFLRSQESGMAAEVESLLKNFDFSSYETIVDVGGGDGALLAAILQANPRSRGVVVDLESTVPAAEQRLVRAGLADRCTICLGDFFREVPGEGDLYLLRHVLHDWSDEDCMTLLRTCARHMSPGATLGVIELAIPDGFDTSLENRMAGLMDLYMMCLFGGGRERSAKEICLLLERAGFTVSSMMRLHNAVGLTIAGPVSLYLTRTILAL